MVPTWCLRSLIRSICVSIVLRSIGSPDTPVALSGQSTIATRSLAWHVTASQLLSVDMSDTLNRAWNERDETSARQMDGNELIAYECYSPHRVRIELSQSKRWRSRPGTYLAFLTLFLLELRIW
ncbi:hypothetical protein L210DRAFT_2223672 [Boletus edulis BED1]|uniref:Secreted protein n=1 Tax=Boletus edulis BED1 TaxID=1328754 RepID=A0AAD4G6J9_BOLED|nr:hypothetical protein L210DRAFT_2223672 [Boletus edulis BED1]